MHHHFLTFYPISEASASIWPSCDATTVVVFASKTLSRTNLCSADDGLHPFLRPTVVPVVVAAHVETAEVYVAGSEYSSLLSTMETDRGIASMCVQGLNHRKTAVMHCLLEMHAG